VLQPGVEFDNTIAARHVHAPYLWVSPPLTISLSTMPDAGPETVTEMLFAAREGQPGAFDALYERVYDELRRLARVVRRRDSNQTINTTALVHEAYLHLVPSKSLNWQDRTHFFRVAARAMRQVLVQAARRRHAAKRGGNAIKVTFDESIHQSDLNLESVIALDDALKRLSEMDARQAQIVECRFFAGLSVEETAEALSIGPSTVKRDWRAARAWLTHELRQ